MKKTKVFRNVVCLLLAIVLLMSENSFVSATALSLDQQEENCQLSGMPELSKTSMKVYTNCKKRLEVYGGSGSIKWSSSNKKIATVSDKGLVKGIKPGTAVITAVRNGHKMKCKVTVRKNQVSYKVDKNARNYTYGEPVAEISKAYYQGNNLIVEMYVMNARMFYARYFSWFKVKVYDDNGSLIASKKFGKIPLNLHAYSTKKVVLKFPSSTVKKKDCVLKDGIYFQYNYYYYYYYHS